MTRRENGPEGGSAPRAEREIQLEPQSERKKQKTT